MGRSIVQRVQLLSLAGSVGLFGALLSACAIGPSEVPPWAKSYEPVTTPTAAPTSTGTPPPSTSTPDAGTPPANPNPTDDAGAGGDDAGGGTGDGGGAQSFSSIFTTYLAAGTVGNCAACHEANPTGSPGDPALLIDNPSDAYTQIMNAAGGCSEVPTVFAWGSGGGLMPLNYTASAQGSAAAAAIAQWVAASCPQ
jgi:mono/diheme cytochrome c family protein